MVYGQNAQLEEGHAGNRAGRVALLTPYFPFFDGIFPDTYRRRQEVNARALADLIRGAGFDVDHLGLTDSVEIAVEHGNRLAAAEPDVLVVAPVMAAPATHSLPAVEIVGCPTVLCQVARRETFGPGYHEIEATEDSTLLGCIMASSGLRDARRPFIQALLSDTGSYDGMFRTIRGAIAAKRLPGARVGVLGDSLKGYLDVQLSKGQLADLGFDSVQIAGQELLDTFMSVDHGAVVGVLDALRQQGVRFDLDPEDMSQDLKLAVAFQRLAERYALDALAMNCHGQLGRQSRDIGIPACIGGTVLASANCPVTCTGDVATAVALLVARQFTPDIFYCEPYTFEFSSQQMVLGSCGIGNLRMASSAPVRVCKNEAYVGCVSAGACVRFAFPPSEATMLAFAARQSKEGKPGSLIWTTGELTGDYFSEMHGPNAVLKLGSADPYSTIESWVSAGPAHHVALAATDLSIELTAMQPFTSMEIQRIQ
jgi:hypothetical protein